MPSYAEKTNYGLLTKAQYHKCWMKSTIESITHLYSNGTNFIDLGSIEGKGNPGRIRTKNVTNYIQQVNVAVTANSWL